MARKFVTILLLLGVCAVAFSGNAMASTQLPANSFAMRCRHGSLVVPTEEVPNFYGIGGGHDRYGYWLTYQSFRDSSRYSIVVDVPGGLPTDLAWTPTLQSRPQPSLEVGRGRPCRVSVVGGLGDRDQQDARFSLAHVSRRSFLVLAAAHAPVHGLDRRAIVGNGGRARVVASLQGYLGGAVFYHLAFAQAGLSSSLSLTHSQYDLPLCYSVGNAYYLVVVARHTTRRITLSDNHGLIVSGHPGHDPYERSSRIFAARLGPGVGDITLNIDAQPTHVINVPQCAY